MRAVVCREVGARPLIGVETMPAPVAGPGQVVVRVAAAGLNYPDLLMTRGLYQHKPAVPFVPGMEAAGTVTAVGPGVASTMLGERLIVSVRTGCMAELVAAGRDQIIGSIPPGWTAEEAAAFPVVAKTAYHALIQRAQLQASETVIVTGASGGTGHMAVKLAQWRGARIVAVTGDAGKAAALTALGATSVVVAADPDATLAALKEACGPDGADVVFDPVGGGLLETVMRACGYGARVCIVGFTGGGPTQIRSNYVLIKGLSVLGIRAGETTQRKAGLADDFKAAVPLLCADARLKPAIWASYALEDISAALTAMENRALVGKIVLRTGAE